MAPQWVSTEECEEGCGECGWGRHCSGYTGLGCLPCPQREAGQGPQGEWESALAGGLQVQRPGGSSVVGVPEGQRRRPGWGEQGADVQGPGDPSKASAVV